MVQSVQSVLRLLVATVLLVAACTPGDLAPPPSPTPLQPEVPPEIVQVVTPALFTDEEAAEPDSAEPPAEGPAPEDEAAPEGEPAPAEEPSPAEEPAAEGEPTSTAAPEEEPAPAEEGPPAEEEAVAADAPTPTSDPEEEPAPAEEEAATPATTPAEAAAPDEAEPTPVDEAPPTEDPAPEQEAAPQQEAAPEEEVDAAQLIELGEQIYTAECAACHQPDGQGTADFPALAASATVVSDDPTPVLDVVLHGRGEMPAFGDVLSNEEIAGVVTYIRNTWENETSPVSPTQVQQVREGEEVTPAEEPEPTPETETAPAEDEPAAPPEEAEEEPAVEEEAPAGEEPTPMPEEAAEEPADEPTPEPDATEPAPVSEAEAQAQELWQELEAAQFAQTWSTVPGKGEFYAGQHPHGALLTTYLSPAAELSMAAKTGTMPDGATIVKVSYTLEQVVQSFAVMQKRTGANPNYGDWYWAAYGPDGEVQFSGSVPGCIACHAAVRSNDYIFTFPLATLSLDEIGDLAPAEPSPPEPTPADEPEEAAEEADGEPTPAATPDADATPTPEGTPDADATPTPAEGPADEPTAETDEDEMGEAEAEELISMGEGVYEANCASCHQSSGQGTAVFPSLVDNPAVTAEDPGAALEVVIHGRGEMPSFGNILSEEEIAAVVSYIRNAWENEAPAVPVATVQQFDEDEPVDEPEEEPTPTPAATPEEEEPDEAEPVPTPTPTTVEEPGEAEPAPEPEEPALSDEELVQLGEGLYTRACAACHQAEGQGAEGAYPPLAGNPFVLNDDPTPVIHVVLTGRAGMPSFDGLLENQEIAAVISYIRNAWENDASAVTRDQVQEVADQIDAEEPAEDPITEPEARPDDEPTPDAAPEAEETPGTGQAPAETPEATPVTTLEATEAPRDEATPATTAEATPAATPATEATPVDEPTPAETSEETPVDEPTPAETPTPEDEAPDEVGEPEAEELISTGEGVYEANCASCHESSGQGTAVFPALAGNPTVTDEDPSAALEMVIHGQGEMPSFGDLLSEEEIAAVVSYIRNAWENEAPAVTQEQVSEAVEGGP